MILQWIRFIIAALLMIAGLFVLLTSTVGIYRFDYVLNRIHVTAKCDTMGMMLTLTSLMFFSGFQVATLKLLLLIVFIWLCSPISGHLIAYLEVATNPDIMKECEVVHDDAD